MNTPAIVKIYNFKNKEVHIEKSLITLEKESGRIVAIGNEAELAMRQHIGSEMVMESPIRQGKIDDYLLAEKTMQYLVKKYSDSKFMKMKTGLIVLHEALSAVEKKAYEDLMYQCGFRNILILDKTAEGLPENQDWTQVIWNIGTANDVTMALEITQDDNYAYVKEAFEDFMSRCTAWGIDAEQVKEWLEGI